MDAFNTFCPYCDQEVPAELYDRLAKVEVLGEPVNFVKTIALCPICRRPIGDARIEGENLQRVYDVYRKRHCLMTAAKIRNLSKWLSTSSIARPYERQAVWAINRSLFLTMPQVPSHFSSFPVLSAPKNSTGSVASAREHAAAWSIVTFPAESRMPYFLPSAAQAARADRISAILTRSFSDRQRTSNVREALWEKMLPR